MTPNVGFQFLDVDTLGGGGKTNVDLFHCRWEGKGMGDKGISEQDDVMSCEWMWWRSQGRVREWDIRG